MAAENENVSPSSGFIGKLWHLVNCESTNGHIKWTENGDGFHITNGAKLAEEILPVYFKHNNISSFIRQLNMYGFRKVNRPETGLARMNSNDLQFTHPNFHRDKGHLLRLIHRKNVTTHHRSPTPINDNMGNSSLDVYRKYRDDSDDAMLERDLSQLMIRFEHLKQSHDDSLQVINSLRADKEKLRIQVERLMETCNRNNYIINQLVSIFLPRMTTEQLAQAQIHGLTKLQITAPSSDSNSKTIHGYEELNANEATTSCLSAVDGPRPTKKRRTVVIPSNKSPTSVATVQNYQTYNPSSAGTKRRLGDTSSGLVIEELPEEPMLPPKAVGQSSSPRALRLIMPTKSSLAKPIHLPLITQPKLEAQVIPPSSVQPPPLVRSPSFPFSDKLEDLFNSDEPLTDQQYGNLNSIIGNKSINLGIESLATPQITPQSLELCSNNAGVSNINNMCESQDLDSLLDFGACHVPHNVPESPSLSPDDFRDLLASPDEIQTVLNPELEQNVVLGSPSSPPLLTPTLPRLTTTSVVPQASPNKKFHIR